MRKSHDITTELVPNVILSAIASGLFTFLFAIFSNQPVIPILISTAILVVLLVSLLATRRFVSDLQAHRHFVIQGEELNYRNFKFQKISDSLDETGQTIINERDWRLVFNFAKIRRGGRYMANLRFRKGSPHARGRIKLSIEGGTVLVPSEVINIEDFSDDRYSYLDKIFEYSGHGDIKINLEPIDDEARLASVIAVDRLDVYPLSN